MAGYMRLALKVFLGTAAVGGLGGGGYYASNSGWLPSLTRGEASIAESTAAEPGAAAGSQPAELDAVASAWAQPLPTERAVEPAHVSPAAHSASESLARADEAAAAKTSADRYGIPSMLTATAAAEESTPVDADAHDTAANAVQADSAYVGNEQPTAVARGQEPPEETTSAQDSVAAESPAGDANVTLDAATDENFAEPKPFNVLPGEPARKPASQRARDAFREQPAAITPSASDRYGAPATPATSSAAVNPFATQSTTAQPQANSQGLIESLPVANSDGSIGTGGLKQLDEGLEPSADRTARSTRGAAASQFEAVGQSIPVGTLPAAGFGSPPVSSGQLSDGMNNASALDGTGKPGERALEGPQNPTLTIQKFAPGEIQVGKAAKFVIQVRNVGNQAASEVVIRDEVPQGTRLISTAPNAQPNGSQLVWQLGKLSAGEERSLEMQLMPTAEGEIGSVATVSYSAQASVKTRCTMPQLAVRMAAPEKVMIGQEQRVKIELRNPGTGDATGVMLFENVPQNVRHAAGPALEFEIGTLRAGEARELELSLVAEKAGKVVNVLTARADGNLQVQQQVEFEVIAPGLAVAVNGPERRYLERPATYEVSVENPGTAPAHDVQIITKLPKGLRFVRANNMGEYDSTSHSVYWSLAELPEGESGKVELVAMPVETGPQTLEVESRASQGLTDQATRQIVIEGLAAIMFEVRDLEDPIEVGGETGYEIRVVNQGTKAATNLRVAVNLPPGLQVVSAEGETQYAAQGNTLVFEPLGQLAAKADTVYRVRAQGTQAGDQRVTVEVHTDDLGQPIRREESTRVFGDE
jgi:uncharacterized repeat protein (TIGR01451 family)